MDLRNIDVPYVSAIGSIMYVMVCTKLDISHVVNVVNRYVDRPRKIHWQVVKWIYIGDLYRRRSLIRYVFTLCSSLISWKVTLQSIVALSTTKAKYMVTIKVVKEVIWLEGFIGDLSL